MKTIFIGILTFFFFQSFYPQEYIWYSDSKNLRNVKPVVNWSKWYLNECYPFLQYRFALDYSMKESGSQYYKTFIVYQIKNMSNKLVEIGHPVVYGRNEKEFGITFDAGWTSDPRMIFLDPYEIIGQDIVKSNGGAFFEGLPSDGFHFIIVGARFLDSVIKSKKEFNHRPTVYNDLIRNNIPFEKCANNKSCTWCNVYNSKCFNNNGNRDCNNWKEVYDYLCKDNFSAGTLNSELIFLNSAIINNNPKSSNQETVRQKDYKDSFNQAQNSLNNGDWNGAANNYNNAIKSANTKGERNIAAVGALSSVLGGVFDGIAKDREAKRKREEEKRWKESEEKLNTANRMDTDWERADQLAELSHYDQAINIMLPYASADKLNGIALNELGFWYWKLEDYNNAIYWYREGVMKQDANAMYNLGVMFENGWGTEKNIETALHWYGKGCEKGYDDACNNKAILEKEVAAEKDDKNLENSNPNISTTETISGELKVITTFQNGIKLKTEIFNILTGKIRYRSIVDKNEKLIEKADFYDNGIIKLRSIYKEGKIIVKSYDEQGNLIEESQQLDKVH